MPGLPFVNLSEAESPEDRAMIEQQNATVQRNLAEMRTGSRPWVEIAPAPAQPDFTNANPLDILASDSKLAFDAGLSQFQAQRAAIQGSVEHKRQLLRQKAQLDIEALQSESSYGLAGEDARLAMQAKEKRLKDLQLRYQKQELDINAEIQPGLDKLAAAEQEFTANATLQRVIAQHDIQNYQGMIERGEIDPAMGRSLQFRAAGKNVPVEAFRRKDDPKEVAHKQYIQDKQEYDDLMGELRNFNYNSKTRRWQALDAKGQVIGDVAPEEQSRLDDLKLQADSLVAPIKQNFWRWRGTATPAITPAAVQAMSPMAQHVRKSMPEVHASAPKGAFAMGGAWLPKPRQQTTPGTGNKSLTEAQARAFLQQTGGNKEQARELARKQGYEIR